MLATSHALQAEPVYTRGASVNGNGFGDSGSLAGPNTRSASGSFSNDSISRSGVAVARSEVATISGFGLAAMSSNGGPASGRAGASASGFFLLDDILLTKLPGFPDLPDTAQTTVRVTFDPGSAFGDFGAISGGLLSSDFTAIDFTGGAPTMTSTAQLTVDQPAFLSLAISVSFEVNAAFGTHSGGFVASLAQQAAFVVPEGYVVNTISGNVIDNDYLGPIGPVVGGVDGDYNFDGNVDAIDYAVWRDVLAAGGDLPNDMTPGLVDTADYELWRVNFGVSLPVSAVIAPVPAPNAALLLCASLLGIAIMDGRNFQSHSAKHHV